jgi:hypothetical protein
MTKDRLFFGALAAVTIVPLGAVALSGLPIPQSGSLRSSLVLFALFVGPAHVASTGFFYFD